MKVRNKLKRKNKAKRDRSERCIKEILSGREENNEEWEKISNKSYTEEEKMWKHERR